MNKGEGPSPQDQLARAEQAGADAADQLWTETEGLSGFFNVEDLRLEQIPSQADNFRTQSLEDYRLISERFPDHISEASEYWNEIETAFQDVQAATAEPEARRALKVILFNNANLARLRRGLENS